MPHMELRNTKRILALCALLTGGLSACDSTPLMRDDYMGVRLVEPDRLPQRVPRDAYGNLRLDQQSDDLSQFWNKLKIW